MDGDILRDSGGCTRQVQEPSAVNSSIMSVSAAKRQVQCNVGNADTDTVSPRQVSVCSVLIRDKVLCYVNNYQEESKAHRADLETCTINVLT